MLCPWYQTCKHCKKYLSIVKFQFRKDTKKYRPICTKCRTVKNKEYYLNNPDKYKHKQTLSKIRYLKKKKEIYEKKKLYNKLTGYNKKYALKNKKILKEKREKYYLENKERLDARRIFLRSQPERKKRINELNRKRYAKNKEKFREYAKAWNLKHKKRLSIERKEKRKNLNHKMKAVLRCRVKAAISRITIQNFKYKYSSSVKLLGASIPDVVKHLEKQFKPGMTWENYGKDGWHIDHIRPCASFDLSKLEEQKKCFHYTNLQPLWAMENISKGAKYEME